MDDPITTPTRIDAAAESEIALTAAELVPLFYADLRRISRHVRRGVPGEPSQTLQTTALIHEAWIKLRNHPRWNDRQHFLRAAALAMRQALVDDARARLAERRNAGQRPLPLELAFDVAADTPDDRVVAIDEALAELAAFSPRLSQTVECRYYAGYTEAETALALGVGVATVQRDWAKARAWLFRRLASSACEGNDGSADDAGDPARPR